MMYVTSIFRLSMDDLLKYIIVADDLMQSAIVNVILIQGLFSIVLLYSDLYLLCHRYHIGSFDCLKSGTGFAISGRSPSIGEKKPIGNFSQVVSSLPITPENA